MGKTLIGKRVSVTIGGKPNNQSDPDTIIGEDTQVHVSDDELKNYDTIIGVQSQITVGGTTNCFASDGIGVFLKTC